MEDKIEKVLIELVKKCTNRPAIARDEGEIPKWVAYDGQFTATVHMRSGEIFTEGLVISKGCWKRWATDEERGFFANELASERAMNRRKELAEGWEVVALHESEPPAPFEHVLGWVGDTRIVASYVGKGGPDLGFRGDAELTTGGVSSSPDDALRRVIESDAWSKSEGSKACACVGPRDYRLAVDAIRIHPETLQGGLVKITGHKGIELVDLSPKEARVVAGLLIEGAAWADSPRCETCLGCASWLDKREGGRHYVACPECNVSGARRGAERDAERRKG